MRHGLLAAGLASCLVHGALLLAHAPWQASGPTDAAMRNETPLAARLHPAQLVGSPPQEEATPAPTPARRGSPQGTGRESSARNTPVTPQEMHYWPADSLERRPVPVSAPDSRWLEGADLPAANVRLRLYIDAEGRVRRTEIVADDAEAWAPVRRMFEETRFLPGRRAGESVPSWLEIELDFLELRRVL
ncbi:MAG: hypothetical protein CGU28_03825 [Candidatus Dactylopiibacterium carminicum]|uniref:TonB C-terminal domain-containing protein n=1 Tax=Candidatus Dactylopiibacterium carminicum TaxID=857335 RepID=A0A272EXB0_9RHOO|nr:hypothetical protein [Candidatus Dactylopiibacterium carminicum]KAF7600225.1 hypothetical protein BGI27_04020 [Candidatus Dactylopiibacterium carminicum]PAS94757.1 MAG: hypothetical protein CGU29_02285 [Candidatus Dactylopiibacterium carminicum]PAS97682.1 MAG: hypothetical protein CGU28_03825 [Candidatus Dactylopiibacterium carminicum]PAT00221.1 MAG: hypothetical protein BSR46_04045 [Candidatus Dactylopiibacterium carminicum]